MTTTDKDSAAEPAAVWVQVSDLKPWADNPRINDGAPVDTVAASIKRFGFGSPIVARKADGEIIAGHTRLKAALQLGLERVPVRYVDLDPAEAHLLALADNPKQNDNYARWDDPKLAELIDGYEPVDLELAGWTSDDLKRIASDLPDFEPADGDEQGRLDQSGIVECPKCGHEFEK